MLRSAQPSQFSTYPSQYIDTPVLAVLVTVQASLLQAVLCLTNESWDMHGSESKQTDNNATETKIAA